MSEAVVRVCDFCGYRESRKPNPLWFAVSDLEMSYTLVEGGVRQSKSCKDVCTGCSEKLGLSLVAK